MCLDKATAEHCCLQLTHYTLAVRGREMDFVRLFLSSRLLICERSNVGFAVHGYGKGGCDGWHVRVRCLGEITWTHAAGRCMRRIPMAEASSETSTARDKLQYLPSALAHSWLFFSESPLTVFRRWVCASPCVCIVLVLLPWRRCTQTQGLKSYLVLLSDLACRSTVSVDSLAFQKDIYK